MLGLFKRSDKVSRKFAKQVSRYCTKVRITGKADDKRLRKLLKKVRRHLKRCLPKDSFYLDINEDSMYKLRITAFHHLNDLERASVGIEDYCINENDAAAEYYVHEVHVRIPIEDSPLFVAFNFKYRVRR